MRCEGLAGAAIEAPFVASNWHGGAGGVAQLHRAGRRGETTSKAAAGAAKRPERVWLSGDFHREKHP